MIGYLFYSLIYLLIYLWIIGVLCLGDIGGQIGLFLGASLLTLLEVLDLLGRVLVIKLKRKKSPHHQV